MWREGHIPCRHILVVGVIDVDVVIHLSLKCFARFLVLLHKSSRGPFDLSSSFTQRQFSQTWCLSFMEFCCYFHSKDALLSEVSSFFFEGEEDLSPWVSAKCLVFFFLFFYWTHNDTALSKRKREKLSWVCGLHFQARLFRHCWCKTPSLWGYFLVFRERRKERSKDLKEQQNGTSLSFSSVSSSTL